jgi:hypothetical protein
LAEADEDYPEKTLGFIEFHHKQKFKQEVQKRMQTTWEDINLWGWGTNQYGQLGIQGVKVEQPRKIPMPPMEIPGDYVVRMSLGRRNLALITKFGEVWVCGNYQKQKVLIKEENTQ